MTYAEAMEKRAADAVVTCTEALETAEGTTDFDTKEVALQRARAAELEIKVLLDVAYDADDVALCESLRSFDEEAWELCVEIENA